MEDYVTLSYCWGGDESMKLLKSNVDDWRREIPFTELPRTIQDAIVTTRRLGQRYLWVDRLCIIQNDAEDLTKQLSVMAEIFKKACFTIVAASVASSADGFLQSRGSASERVANPRLALPYRCSDGKTGLVGLNTKTQHFLALTADKNAINARAWTYQEQNVSTRLVGLPKNLFPKTCLGVKKGVPSIHPSTRKSQSVKTHVTFASVCMTR
jgi:hypothetical protein